MQLSICIITRNEEQNMIRCLKSIRPYNVEIVVVDTGSTDHTREIACRYTEHVYDFAWCDDFAAAKNYAISKAGNPYVMVLDSDEYLLEFPEQKLSELLTEHPDEVGRIFRKNYLTRNGQKRENTEWVHRIFLKDRFCYEGRIHEQVVAADGSTYDTYRTPVVIGHTGYDLPEEARKKKAQRNLKLLQVELDRLLQEKGVSSVEEDIEQSKGMGEQIPYILYQIGKSYYMAQDYGSACIYFSQGLSYDLNPKLEYVIDMVETYGYALLNSGQAESALFFRNIYEEFGNSADFQFLMGLIYMNNEQFEAAIQEFLKAVTHKECRNSGVNSYAAYYNIGVIYECTGELEKARTYFERCGDYVPAKKQLLTLPTPAQSSGLPDLP